MRICDILEMVVLVINRVFWGRVRGAVAIIALLTVILPTTSRAETANDARLSRMSDRQLHYAGNAYLQQRNLPDSALMCYTLMIQRYAGRHQLTAAQREYLANGYNNTGYVYMFSYYDYGKALDNLIRAQELCKGREPLMLLLNLGHITDFYAQCFPTEDNIRLSHEYYKKVFFIALDRHDWHTACIAFANLWNFGFTPRMIEINKEVLTQFKRLAKTDDPENVSARCLYAAIRSIQYGQTAEAVRQIKSYALSGDRMADSQRLGCQALWYMTQIFELTGQQDSVLHYARLLDDVAHRDGLKDFQMDADQLLYSCYTTRGDRAKAAEYRLQCYEKRDSLLILRNLNSVRSNYLLHSLRSASREMDSLKQVKRAQDIVVVAVLAGIAVAVILLSVVYRQNRELRQSNRMLYRKNEEMLAHEEAEKQKLRQQVAATTPEDKPKYQGSLLDEETKDQLYTKVEQVMVSSPLIYHEDFTIDSLARLCDTSYKKLSQVINERYGYSFSIFLSEYRIKEACKRIGDFDRYGNQTIEAIGMSVGFKARSGFFRAFKRVTGLTPSEYQKLAREKFQES